MTEQESLDEHLERLQNDPDSVRAEFEAELLEEHGQEWVDENKQYFDGWWAQSLAQV